MKENLKTKKQFLSRWPTNSPVEIIGFIGLMCHVFLFCTFSSLVRDVEFPEPSLNCARHLDGLHNTKASKCGTIRLSVPRNRLWRGLFTGAIHNSLRPFSTFTFTRRNPHQVHTAELHPIRPRRPTYIFTSAY